MDLDKVNSVNSEARFLCMQKVVGTIHQRLSSDASFACRAFVAIADAFRSIGELFAIEMFSSKESLAQREIRQEFQQLSQAVNEGKPYQELLQKVVASFADRVTGMDSEMTSVQIASLFQDTMTQLSQARRNAIAAVLPEKVEELTKEIRAQLKIAEPQEGETNREETASSAESLLYTVGSTAMICLAAVALVLLAKKVFRPSASTAFRPTLLVNDGAVGVDKDASWLRRLDFCVKHGLCPHFVRL